VDFLYLPSKIFVNNSLKYYIEVIYEIAFCLELPVTVIFWGFLFKEVKSDSALKILLQCNLHAGALVALLIDFISNSFSFPSQHVAIVMFVSLFYGMINLIYTLNVHNIYPPVTWRSFLSYLLCVGFIVMILFMHFLGRFVYNKWKKEKMNTFM
jgi:hypothetical protein